MFDQLDADDLYTELVMQRANDARAFILVEGATDCAVLDRFLDTSSFTTVPAHGKERAEGAVERVHSGTGLTHVYAVLDRDWVGLLEEGMDHHAVVYTDFYDLDACIFFAPDVYQGLAAGFCTDLSFRAGAPGCTPDDITRACTDLALPVGVLRYLSRRDGLGLNLRDFPLSQVVENAARVDLAKLVDLACRRAGKDPVDYGDLVPRLRTETQRVADAAPHRYCSGHDLAKAFALIARRRWASKAGHDIIERSARAALSHDAFAQTSIYSDSRHWTASAGRTAWRARTAPASPPEGAPTTESHGTQLPRQAGSATQAPTRH
ncbi:hypothetical protein [Streptomyces atriruber]|uniref:hypothetical protein n=1 Tax=Streptomyces atriruber TaxID=545121 RepID=UPI0006E16392|nr:hypothetical protein [Streptomyces atriruber]